MPINGGSNTCQGLSDLMILGKTSDHLHIPISKFAHSYFIVLGKMVGQGDSGKDWKALGSDKQAIIVYYKCRSALIS